MKLRTVIKKELLIIFIPGAISVIATGLAYTLPVGGLAGIAIVIAILFGVGAVVCAILIAAECL